MTITQLTSDQLKQLLDLHSASAVPESVDNSFLPFFAALPRTLLNEMVKELRLPAGAIVFQEGAAGDAMYLVRSGSLLVFKGDLEAPTILSYRKTGEVVGEMALIENRPRFATVVAATSVWLLCVDRENFQRLLALHPEIGLNFLRAFSARLRESDQVRLQNTLDLHEASTQVSDLSVEKQHLLETQRLRQQTADFVMHDLRSPLSSVANALHLLKMTLPEEILHENDEILDAAFAATQKLMRLANSFLEATRLEAGKAQLDLTEVSLSELADGVIRRVPSFNSKGVKILNTIPAQFPQVRVDYDKLDGVLSNLVDNALKYAPSESQVTIAAEALPQEIQVSVTDAGVGIPPEERGKIFERFLQVTSAMSRRGFGLGLAFCRLAVEAHGGRIWVEDGLNGQGSRFVFTLPRAEPVTN